MSKSLPDCAAQHFGLWLMDPMRLQELVSLWKAGALGDVQAAWRERVDDPLSFAVNDDGIALIDIVGMMTKGMPCLVR